MRSVSHRDLRNRSGELLRAAAAGESFLVTNSGTPVARLVPIDAPNTAPSPAKPATRVGGFAALTRARIDEASAAHLSAMRDDR